MAGGFFDSPGAIQAISQQHSIVLNDTLLFFYEVFELEFHNGNWRTFSPDKWLASRDVVTPTNSRLEGYDVVTFWPENSPAPEHSPLSCNLLANKLRTNSHCLFETFEEAQSAVNDGNFAHAEPGALRIFAVFSVDWPSPSSVAGE